MESIDSRLGDDLLDDVLTAPSRAHNATPPNADEVCAMTVKSYDSIYMCFFVVFTFSFLESR